MGPDEFISVTADLVRRVGSANAALVWARINFVCQVPGYDRVEDESGRWWVASMSKLSNDIGLSPKAIRRTLENLIAEEHLEAQRMDESSWDRSWAYRTVGPIAAAQPHLPIRSNALDHMGKCIGPEGQIDVPKRADVPYIEEVKNSPVENDREDVLELCTILQSRMVDNGCRKPSITARWKTDMRLLIDKDGVPLEVAKSVLEWSQQDSFWKGNIHSPSKFRKQFDALKLRMEESGYRPPATDGSVTKWLRECWKQADTKSVEERSGLTYRQPDPPEDVDVREFHRQARKQWITDHHDEIIRRIMAREASAA